MVVAALLADVVVGILRADVAGGPPVVAVVARTIALALRRSMESFLRIFIHTIFRSQ